MNRIKYINIDTRFNSRYCNFPFSDYYIELPHRIHHIKTFTIISIEVPITFYNICDALNNNCFKITKVSAKKDEDYNRTILIRIPDNNYTLDALQKTISDVIKSNNLDDIKVAFSKNNTLKIISHSNDYMIDFAIDKNGNKDNYDIKSKLGWILGFRTNTHFIQSSDEQPSEKVEPDQTLCNLMNPRYLYLEVLEYEHNKHNENNHLFSSSLLGSHISKYIIARITTDYKNFPFGSMLNANLLNGYLISNIRHYKRKIKLVDLKIRLLNEFGIPICLNGFEISLCAQVECEESECTTTSTNETT